MMELERIKKILKEHEKELKEKYRVKTIGIFGSYVRGEQKSKVISTYLLNLKSQLIF